MPSQRPRLEEIEELERGARIKAAVAAGVLADHPLIVRKYRLLADTARHSSSGTTIVDDFLAPTQYRVSGHDRSHAVLGARGECATVHPSQVAIALVALGAHVETSLPDGNRRILPADAVHRLPGGTSRIPHQLRTGERITHFVLPPAAKYQHYRRAPDPLFNDVTAASLAIAFDLELDHFMNIRISLGCVASKPWRAARAEEVLEGKAPSPELFARAADAELAEAKGCGHGAFKIPLARKLLVDGLAELTRVRADALSTA